MASIPFWFGAQAFSGTAAAAQTTLAAYTSQTDQVLVVRFQDIAPNALDGGGTASPATATNPGEEWLAAICFNAVNVTANTLNIARLAVALRGGSSLDQGYYLPGQNFRIRPVTINFYQTDDGTLNPVAGMF